MSQCLLSYKLDMDFIFSDVANHILSGKLHSFSCNSRNGFAAHQQLRHEVFHLDNCLGPQAALNKTAGNDAAHLCLLILIGTKQSNSHVSTRV